MQIGCETIFRRCMRIEQHDRADLSAMAYAMGDHMHEHLLARHAARHAIREREVDLLRQLATIKPRHIVDVFPIAFSDVCGQIFQRRHLAQVC